MTYETKVTIPKTVTGKDLSDLLITAIEGGVFYWLESLTIRKLNGEVISYQCETLFDEPFRMIAEDVEGEATRAVHNGIGGDYSDFAAALELMPLHHLTNFLNENYDAETGDVFLQCALFGEIVYG